MARWYQGINGEGPPSLNFNRTFVDIKSATIFKGFLAPSRRSDMGYKNSFIFLSYQGIFYLLSKKEKKGIFYQINGKLNKFCQKVIETDSREGKIIAWEPQIEVLCIYMGSGAAAGAAWLVCLTDRQEGSWIDGRRGRRRKRRRRGRGGGAGGGEH